MVVLVAVVVEAMALQPMLAVLEHRAKVMRVQQVT
jgi:hypothetical protein